MAADNSFFITDRTRSAFDGIVTIPVSVPLVTRLLTLTRRPLQVAWQNSITQRFIPALRPELITASLISLLLLVLPVRHLIAVPLGVTTLGVANFLGACIGLAWGLTVQTRGDLRQPDTFHILLALFVLWASLSTWWSISPSESVASALDYLSFLIISYILWDIARSRKIVYRWSQAYVAGQTLAIAGIGMNVLQGQLYSSGRYSGLSQNPNILAVELAIAIPLVVLVAVWERDGSMKRVKQLIYMEFAVVAVVAILLTGSRQALLALMASLVPIAMVAIALRPPLQRVAILVGSILVGLVVVVALPTSVVQRLVSLGEVLLELISGMAVDSLVGTRIVRIIAGLRLFVAHPLLGVGAGGYPIAVVEQLGVSWPAGNVSDNTFITIAANLGVVGASLFVGLVLYVAGRVRRLQPMAAVSLLGVIVVWIVAALANNQEVSILTWFVFTLVVIAAETSAE